MNTDQQRLNDLQRERVKDALMALSGLGPSTVWKQFDALCAGDEIVRKEVRSLLNARFGVPPSSAPEQPLPLALFAGRFRATAYLGAGSFGDVYRVVDTRTGAVRALKKLRATDPRALAYFKSEFRLLTGRLPARGGPYPNIATLYELYEHDDEGWFFTMELVEGVNLLSYLRSRPPGQCFDAARHCLEQLVRGLGILHGELEILHRDLKPENILVTADGRLVLLDFSLAQTLTADPRRGTIAGTPEFMSPEQLDGGALTAASDWYAVGVLLYYALTGTSPFPATSPFHDRSRDSIVPPRTMHSDTPEDLSNLCMSLLEADPVRRASGTDVLECLGRREPRVALHPQRTTPFVGRDEQIASLEAAFGRSAIAPVVVHMTGPSGIGKTSLIQKFVERASRDTTTLVLAGRCHYAESIRYKGLDGIVDELTLKLKEWSRTEFERVRPRGFSHLVQMFPVLGQLTRDASVSESADSADARVRGWAALREMLGRIAERHRLILIVDDLQWCGDDGLIALSELLWSADSPPALAILAYRSEDLAERRPGRPRAEGRPDAFELLQSRAMPADTITLGGLATAEATGLLAALSSETLSSSAAARAATATLGNPFLIHEMARWLRVHGPAEHEVLEDVDDAVSAHLAGLLPDWRRFIEVVAVAGQPTELAVVQYAAGRVDGIAARNVLERERLARWLTVREKDQIDVYHDRIRAVLLKNMPEEHRRAHHIAIAEALEDCGVDDAVRKAVHWSMGGVAERAAPHALVAADEAGAALAFNEAVRFYELALTSTTLVGDARRNVHERLADALANSGRGPEAARVYLDAAKSAPAEASARLKSRAASQYLRCGHVDTGVQLLDSLLQQVNQAPSRKRTARLLSLAWLRARIRMTNLLRADRAAGNLTDEDRLRLELYWTGAMGLSLFDPVGSAEFSSRYVLLASQSGDSYHMAIALGGEAAWACTSGSERQVARGRSYLAKAEELAQTIADPRVHGYLLVIRSVMAFLLGDWKASCLYGDRAINKLRAECVNVAWELTLVNVITFQARCALGEWAQNRRRLTDLLQDAKVRGDRNAELGIALLGGTYVLALAADEPERSVTELRAAVDQWPKTDSDFSAYNTLQAELDVALYEDQPMRAWNRLQRQWAALRRSPQFRNATTSTFLQFARGRVAIAAACAATEGTAAEFLKVADAASRFLARPSVPWGQGLGGVLRAGIATCRGDIATARHELREAERRLDAANLRPFRMAALYRLESIDGVEPGASMPAVWAREEEVVNPPRFLSALAPGRYPSHHSTPAM